MKKLILSLMATGVAGLLVSASAQPATGEDNNGNAAPPADMPATPPPDMGPPPDAGAMPPDITPAEAGANANGATTGSTQVKEPLIITPSKARGPEPDAAPTAFVPPTQAGTNANDLNLNFNRAPLDMVLNYLSDAAGFIVVQDTHISSSATVTINGKHLTREEVVNLLNSVLNKNGYAVIRDGRTLTVVDKNDAKTREIPVKSGNNPDDIPKTAEIVTQIIPIRFVEARQLVSDLSSFVSPQATVVANEAGNSIIVTDTQSNIRHLAEIIRAIDNSAEAETEIRVFPLKYASPTDVATELTSVFPNSTSGNNAQSPIRFGGGPGGGPGGFFARMMAGNAGASSSANDRVKKATAVTAVADSRIQAVIVTAPKDLIDEISGVIKSLDVPSERDQNVYVFKMNNGDPQQAAQVLQNMFQSSSARTTSGSSQNSALQQRAQNNVTQQSSSSSGYGTGFGAGAGGGGRTGLGTQF
ncbi:MAG TPA: secretin N-terminal domain-containing protein [Verrucomicrobiae bacterium]